VDNCLRAAAERYYFVQDGARFAPPPKSKLRIFSTLNYIKHKIANSIDVSKLSYKDFVSLYDGKRKCRYQTAVDTLVADPLCSKDAYIKAFVKAELISVTSDHYNPVLRKVVSGKPDPAPRAISPRSPRYNVEVGRFLRPLEHKIYGAIAGLFGGKTVAKGMNATETAAVLVEMFNEFDDPVAIMLDAHRFDQHVGVDCLKWEHSVYNEIYNDPNLRRFLKMQLKNRIRFICRDGMVICVLDGRRMSGDMNTALGNCLIMCVLIYHYLQTLKIRGRLLNNGDDCTVVMSRKNEEEFVAGVAAYFLDYGFTMKVEKPVYVLEEIEFCKTQPVWNGTEYVMCRKFPDCVDKDSISFLPINNDQSLNNYYHDLGACGQALTSGLPVLSKFYAMLSRFAGSAKGFNRDISQRTGMEILSWRMIRRDSPITERARYSFYLAFGITPSEQIDLEHKYSTMQRIPYCSRVVDEFQVVQPWYLMSK